jgi:8-oxo-dGTP pyrophosphatase MutT (NUDIX family)
MKYNSTTKKGIHSYGVILIAQDGKLLICRKADTYGFLDFLRGKWDCQSDAQKLLSKTTQAEKDKLRACHLGHLCDLYGADYGNLSRKFGGENQKKVMNRWLNLCTNIKGDFEFPKGRSIKGEEDIVCAIREFYEETGISLEQFPVSKNTTLKEKINCDTVTYTVKYFLVTYPSISTDIDVTKFCKKEVSKLLWIDKNNAPSFLSKNKVKIVDRVLDMYELFLMKDSTNGVS